MSTTMLSTPSTHHSKHVSKAREYKSTTSTQARQTREHTKHVSTQTRQAREHART